MDTNQTVQYAAEGQNVWGEVLIFIAIALVLYGMFKLLIARRPPISN
jgi:hypothetical protein